MNQLIKYITIVFFLFIKNVLAQNLNYPNKKFQPQDSTLFDYYVDEHEYYCNRNLDSASYYLDLAEKQINFNDTIRFLVYRSFKCRFNYITREPISTVIEECVCGLEQASQMEYLYYQLRFLKILAACQSINVPGGAYSYNLEAYEIAKKMDSREEVNMVLFNMAVNSYRDRRVQDAEKYLSEIRKDLNNPDHFFKYYLLKAKLENYIGEAIRYIDSADYVATQHNLNYLKEYIYLEKAMIYRKYGMYEESLEFYLKNDSLHLDDPDYIFKNQIAFDKSKLFYDLGDIEKAKYHFDVFLESKYARDSKMPSSFNRFAYKLYSAIEDTTSAFVFLQKVYEDLNVRNELYRDSIFQVYRNRYELDKKQNDLERKEAKIFSYKNKQKLILLVGLIVVLIMLLFFQVRQQKKQSEILRIRNNLENEKKLNQLRKHFVENITHEIRTPITLIKGIFENLIRMNKSNDLLEIGLKNTEQLVHDMEQILEFVKSDSIKMQIEEEEVNVLTFLTELIDCYKINIFSKGLKLLFNHNLTKQTSLYIDKEKLFVILSNFLSNAIKFSNEGGEIHLNVNVSKDTILFQVKDFAGSLLEKDIPYIFNRFYKGDNSFVTNGHGIGLSLSYEFTMLLQGEIYTKVNREEKSTCFYLKIQQKEILYSQDNIIVEIQADYNNPLKLSDNNADNPKILVVDDNELMIQFYRNVLSDYYICDYVFDGSQALEKLKVETYECVLLDIMMPKMDGIELVKKIKQVEFIKNIPIVFVTAKDFDETRQEAFNLGIHDFIKKPFVLQELLARIRNVINNSRNHTTSLNEFITSDSKFKEHDIPDDSKMLEHVISIINEHMGDESFGVEQLATMAFYSIRHFRRKIKTITGLTPRELLLEVRLKKAYDILQNNDSVRVSDVQLLIGLKSTTYFNKKFKERFGISPSYVRSQVNKVEG